jgi:cytoskeletal protein RodZ
VGTFGDKLRQHREHRGLSIEAISASTKIGTRMLAAIEDERFDQLPGGVFNKGFIRAYARQVGLNEDETVADYLTALRESQIQSQTAVPNFRKENRPAPLADLPPRKDIEKRGVTEKRDEASGPKPEINRSQPATEISVSSTAQSQTEDRRNLPDRRLQSRRSADHPIEHHPTEDRLIEDLHSQVRNGEDPQGEDPEDPPLVSRPMEVPYTEQLPVEHQPPEHHATPAENYPVEYATEDEPFTPPPSFLNLSTPPQDYYEPEAARGRSSQPPVRWRNLALPLILLTLALALWGLHRRNSSASSASASSPSAASEPTTSQIATPQPVPFSGSVASTSPPTPTTPSPIVKPAAVHPTPTPATTPVTIPAPAPAGPAPAVHSQPKAAKPTPLPTFTLIIRAAKTSWVSITADGQPIAQETLIAPAHTSVRATQEIVVKTRNAAALSFSLNHLEIPAQGAEGEGRTYTFNANGLRDSAPSSTATR